MPMWTRRCLIFFALTISVICDRVPGTLANNMKRGEESKYTRAEANALVKLRKLVTDALYEDYMHRDEYLISWLRARNLDPARANDMLRANLKWRKEENIDNLENEPFPQFEKTYPTGVTGRDREGRPVAVISYSSFDIRKAVLSGQIKQLVRYLVKNALEIPTNLARREGHADGTNATQFLVIGNLAGYNLRQHACVRCFELPLGYVQNYVAHYPNLAWQTLSIGNPRIAAPVVTFVKPFFSKHLTENLHLLGPNREEWKPYLDKIVSPDQLPKGYGGTL